jgi:hypothetical protein
MKKEGQSSEVPKKNAEGKDEQEKIMVWSYAS